LSTTTTTKRVRWECPTGKHPGVLASTRPTKDSIVRYCLSCSVETGKLALRIAPALERKRSAAAESAAAKAKVKRARAAAAKAKKKAAENERYMVEGVDLRVEYRKLLKLRTFGRKFFTRNRDGEMELFPPELVISRRTSYPLSQLGYAQQIGWGFHKITIATYPGQTLADARETLVHEIVHVYVGLEHGHDARFRETMTKAFKEAYKVLPVGVAHNRYHGRYAEALMRKEKAASEGGAA
jgi:hypothetical protein